MENEPPSPEKIPQPTAPEAMPASSPAEPKTVEPPVDNSTPLSNTNTVPVDKPARDSWAWVMWGALFLVVALIITVLAWRMLANNESNVPEPAELEEVAEEQTEPAPAEESEEADSDYVTFEEKDTISYTFEYPNSDEWEAKFDKIVDKSSYEQSQVIVTGPDGISGIIYQPLLSAGFESWSPDNRTELVNKDNQVFTRTYGPSIDKSIDSHLYLAFTTKDTGTENSYSFVVFADEINEENAAILDKIVESIKLRE